jgi:hypothetical protein
MTRGVAAVLAAFVMVFGAAGCGSEPDVAACKAAMKEQFKEATADPAGPDATRPAECDGVDDATLQRLAGEVMGEAVGG